MLVGTALARFACWQRYLLELQEYALTTSAAHSALDRALAFVTSPHWRG